jgi:hypothetical protein
VSEYQNYPSGMKSALPYLLASIIHHEEFLRRNLHPEHPIFGARVFQHSLIDTLRGSTVTGIGRCSHTDMVATGVPPHLALAEQMYQLQEKNKKLENALIELKENVIQRMLQ